MQLDSEGVTDARILSVVFDEDGFLQDQALWTEGLAERLANAADLGPLTSRHWEAIRFIRDKYLTTGGLPLMRHFCRQLGMRPDAVKGLFGGCRQLWRIAGLPNPGEEAKSYMD